METSQRLFDCLRQLKKQKPDAIMMANKVTGQWKTYTTLEIIDHVDKLAAGLIHMGIGPNDGTVEGRDKIAILCKNRPEWVFLDLAIQKIGAILVPIYPTISGGELEYILKDAAVKIVFVNDESSLQKVQSIKDRLPLLQEIYTFEHVREGIHWKKLLDSASQELLEEVERRASKVNNQDVLTLIYTSGTTGTPKGVMLTQNNLLSNVKSCLPCFPPGDNLKALSFLPLNHIFERMVTYLYLFQGTCIYYAESMESIGENLLEVKPHLFTTVPRLLEKVYDKIMAKGNKLSGVKKKLFFWAHGLAEKFEINKNQPLFFRLQLALSLFSY